MRIALITDAGSPGISDPGFYLVRACIQQDVPVEALAWGVLAAGILHVHAQDGQHGYKGVPQGVDINDRPFP